MNTYPAYKVCAAHVAPVYLNTEATVNKACALIAEAARNGARLIAFPESFLPAFPVWAAVLPPIKGHELFKRLAEEALSVPGPEVKRIAEAARQHHMVVSLGLSEISPVSVGCLWNTNVLIGDDGRILNHHRKLVPTYYEKLVWANGDGAGVRVSETAIGKIGMLICGENTNPLARFALLAQGEQVHISSYPPVWPTRDPGESQRYDLASAIRIRAGAHAFEGKVFNIVSSAFLDETALKALASLGKEALRILTESPRSVSMVIGPAGEVISDTLCDTEGLLYCDIDLALCVEPKQFHDVVGYYNRFDVFRLSINQERLRPIAFEVLAPSQTAGREPADDTAAALELEAQR